MNHQSKNCETCRFLAHSTLPGVGHCDSPREVMPSWQSDRRLVNIRAVRDCTAWQDKEEHDDESVC